MLLCIPDVLTPDDARRCREAALAADWEDGRATAGPQSAAVKSNRQLPLDSRVGASLGEAISRALLSNALFLSAALPLRIMPPMFNRYGHGQTFGAHVDNAIRRVRGMDATIRTDLSATLFLSDPDSYEGGELTVETPSGAQAVKLPAGHMVLYPATSLHLVTPVTRGERISSFFWVQSMIRSAERRTILFDLDQTIQEIQAQAGHEDPNGLRLTGIYHNLIRQWAET